jgi:hypothetical protein
MGRLKAAWCLVVFGFGAKWLSLMVLWVGLFKQLYENSKDNPGLAQLFPLIGLMNQLFEYIPRFLWAAAPTPGWSWIHLGVIIFCCQLLEDFGRWLARRVPSTMYSQVFMGRAIFRDNPCAVIGLRPHQ